jgi:hypothetical protein
MPALNGLKTHAELSRGCGTRLQYMAGCRCYQCRTANSAYERGRLVARKAGDYNGIVSAEKARQHILKLRKKGVGRKAVYAASDVALSILRAISSGEKKQIRARTERKILAVTPACREDGALVSAKPTWRLVALLLEEGFTKLRIARELGQKGRGLQLGKKQITVRNAARVERLYNRYMR